MNGAGFVAVGVGAAVGAWLRWWLSVSFNGLIANLPLGTLAANLGGGFLVGMSYAFFSGMTSLAPEWRLLIVTGFLGGLTTFSTFSAESMVLMQKGQFIWAALHSLVHLTGSILCCFLGFSVFRWMQ